MAQGDRSKLNRLVRIFVRQLQRVEDAFVDMRGKLVLKTAAGAQLDIYGDLVGEQRLGRDDAEYRDAIYFAMFLNAGNGEPELLIRAAKRLTQADTVSYSELYPAKVHIEYTGETIFQNVKKKLQALCSAGVKLLLSAGLGADGFIMDSVIGPLPDSEGLGFSSEDQIEGGQFSTLIGG